jgi:uncharacterized protein YcbX
VAHVAELITYPIKGCAGTSLSDSELTAAGLAHDRSFMVVGPGGVFRSQRRDPALARVRPAISADGAELVLRADGIAALPVSVDTAGPRQPVSLFGTPWTGVDQGDAAADWLSDVLGAPSRLVRVPPEHDRAVDGQHPGRAGYADSGALLVVSRASWVRVNEQIAAGGGEPVPLDRYRANVVVDGWADPHTEDLARVVAVGEVELGYAKLAIRCAVTLVDQQLGRKAGLEPLRTLARHRRARGGGVAFGAKFSVLRRGKLSVGDELTVTEWGDSEL